MRKKLFSLLGRCAAVILALIILLLTASLGVIMILSKGPSPTAQRLFVLSVKETSAAGFLANLFLSDEEVESILHANVENNQQQEMDLSLIKIDSAPSQETNISESTVETEYISPETTPIFSDNAKEDAETNMQTESSEENTGIEIIDIKGQTYNGKLMIISDPKRVFVGVPDSYGESSHGLTVAAMIKKYNAVAGTNAGGFYDPNGQGTGGIPDGIVISEGKLLSGELASSYSIAGIDSDGILHVGNMSAQHALDIGIQYAASYGPALVINGSSAGGKYGLGGGLNPRTAIGQRSDGAILLLVINGRSIDSLGATLDDLAEIMLEYGAVNATNLDGGSSSIMIMEDEFLTSSAYLFGERVVATAILVKP